MLRRRRPEARQVRRVRTRGRLRGKHTHGRWCGRLFADGVMPPLMLAGVLRLLCRRDRQTGRVGDRPAPHDRHEDREDEYHANAPPADRGEAAGPGGRERHDWATIATFTCSRTGRQRYIEAGREDCSSRSPVAHVGRADCYGPRIATAHDTRASGLSAWRVSRVVVVLVLLVHLAALHGMATTPPAFVAAVQQDVGHAPNCDEQVQAPVAASPVRAARSGASSPETGCPHSLSAVFLAVPRGPTLPREHAPAVSSPSSGRALLTILSVDRS